MQMGVLFPLSFVRAIAAAFERSFNDLETASTFWRNSLIARSNYLVIRRGVLLME